MDYLKECYMKDYKYSEEKFQYWFDLIIEDAWMHEKNEALYVFCLIPKIHYKRITPINFGRSYWGLNIFNWAPRISLDPVYRIAIRETDEIWTNRRTLKNKTMKEEERLKIIENEVERRYKIKALAAVNNLPRKWIKRKSNKKPWKQYCHKENLISREKSLIIG
jgi:hypothetical protein